MTPPLTAELAPPRRANRTAATLAVALAALVAAVVFSLAVGAVPLAPGRVLAILTGSDIGTSATDLRDRVIVLNVRLPRTVLALIVGATTALAGAVMQGLFRNPLADPGILGVSSGAALAAALWIVIVSATATGGGLLAELGLPVSAFVGSLLATALLQLIATRDGHTSVATLLLAGVALTGLASAITGFLIFVSSDQQLRDFTFWMLGSLGGASWQKVLLVLPFGLVAALSPILARSLDGLALGESEAGYAGIDVEWVKRIAVIGVAAAIGASVAVSGVIAFFGLAVPHIVRLALGPAHRLLLPVVGLTGATLLILADCFARTVAAPAELPLGVVTAATGAPLMLWLLVRRDRLIRG